MKADSSFRVVMFLLLALPIVCTGQSEISESAKDLKESWQRVSVPDAKLRAVYFSVDQGLYKGAGLEIKSRLPFSVFIDGKLIAHSLKGKVVFDLDSLARIYTSQLDFAVHTQDADKWLTTRLIYQSSQAVAHPEENFLRKDLFFLNFSVLAVLLLFVSFVLLVGTNPKLTLDYLNFIKLFSIQDREETILTSRITSSVNILFYAFASFFGSLLLMVIFHYAPQGSPLAQSFQATTLGQAFLQWSKLAIIIFSLLAVKLILIYLFSALFNMGEIAPIQFFNYLRLFLFMFGVVGFLTLLFFMLKILDPSWYSGLLGVSLTLLILWKVILFLKLIARAHFRVFHLFSYLCASEIIPFVILIKGVFF